jgi:hypothetical protein
VACGRMCPAASRRASSWTRCGAPASPGRVCHSVLLYSSECAQ